MFYVPMGILFKLIVVSAKDVVGNIAGGLTWASAHIIINIKHIIYTNVYFSFFFPFKLQEIKNTLKTLSPSNPV
jgi:hypothetical protein